MRERFSCWPLGRQLCGKDWTFMAVLAAMILACEKPKLRNQPCCAGLLSSTTIRQWVTFSVAQFVVICYAALENWYTTYILIAPKFGFPVQSCLLNFSLIFNYLFDISIWGHCILNTSQPGPPLFFSFNSLFLQSFSSQNWQLYPQSCLMQKIWMMFHVQSIRKSFEYSFKTFPEFTTSH